MPVSATMAGTPHYVLLDGDGRLGPKVMQLDAGVGCKPIYGFSDKGPYDKFCANSALALRPYPLVKGYLRKQSEAFGDALKLVVLDAAGPRDTFLRAATIEAVLEAQERQAAHVTVAYGLTFVSEAVAYSVEEVAD